LIITANIYIIIWIIYILNNAVYNFVFVNEKKEQSVSNVLIFENNNKKNANLFSN